jgi:hypothetical protein
MGCANLAARSNVQLQAHIRVAAQNTASIVITGHAAAQMKKRYLGINEVYDCLRNGMIVRPPKVNADHGTLECRMERYVGGREIAVVVALCDEDPNLIVVTVFHV